MADFWYSLKCIRCGACMNTCPVHRRSGGLSYGATYRTDRRHHRPDVQPGESTARCRSPRRSMAVAPVCPVKINIHEQIYKWREIIAERHQLPFVKQEAMHVAGKVLSSPKLYRAAVETAAAASTSPAAHRDVQPAECLGPAT